MNNILGVQLCSQPQNSINDKTCEKQNLRQSLFFLSNLKKHRWSKGNDLFGLGRKSDFLQNLQEVVLEVLTRKFLFWGQKTAGSVKEGGRLRVWTHVGFHKGNYTNSFAITHELLLHKILHGLFFVSVCVVVQKVLLEWWTAL